MTVGRYAVLLHVMLQGVLIIKSIIPDNINVNITHNNSTDKRKLRKLLIGDSTIKNTGYIKGTSIIVMPGKELSFLLNYLE